MADKLGWDEIERRYPDEWVVLVDYTFDDNEDLIDGVVYAHGPDRSQAYAGCRGGPQSTAVRYTGETRGGRIGFSVDAEEVSADCP